MDHSDIGIEQWRQRGPNRTTKVSVLPLRLFRLYGQAVQCQKTVSNLLDQKTSVNGIFRHLYLVGSLVPLRKAGKTLERFQPIQNLKHAEGGPLLSRQAG